MKLENLDKLPNLQKLDINFNQIMKLENLDKLPNLQQLLIFLNQITKLENLDKLPNLKQLIISHNQITSNIDLAFLRQFPQLDDLDIRSNPLGNIPPEVVQEENCLADLLCYLLDLEEGGQPNNEVKVLLIGNGNVGKTQVAKRLELADRFVFDTQHNSTHAISLLQRQLPCRSLPIEGLLLNLWDFGGQDLYHATHRLFMRTRALFLLVWDKDSEVAPYHTWQGDDYKNEPLRYWLSYAQYFGENSPIVVVQNKIDATAQLPDPYPDPAQKELKRLYPTIQRFVGLSAKTGKGFEVLKLRIAEVFEQTPELKADLLDKKLPKTWVQVRNRIREEQAKPNGLTDIDFATFEQWCREAKIGASVQALAHFLHHSGVIYYQGNYFAGRIIINQAWAISAVYKILDREGCYYEVLEDNKGKLCYGDVCKIWQTHSDKERELFLNFMLSSELCFETTPNKNDNPPLQDRTFVVPQLLPEQEPDYMLTYQQGKKANQQKCFEYRFLPSVFIQRFIIKAHRFSDHQYMWQQGIGLEYKEGWATVRASYAPYSITIWYNTAAQQNGLLKAIKEELQALENEDKNIPHPERKKEGFDALSLFNQSSPQNNTQTMKKLNVFISYSHKDEAFKDALDAHLSMLKHSNKIATWSDQAILASTEWDNEIKQQLANAHIIVLLVSASFLASDYIWKEELSHAMERHENGTARIIPVFIKACDWKDAPFASIQGLPRDAKPIGTADNDEVWTAVAQGIRAVVADAQQRGIGVAEITPINTPVDTPSTTNKTPLPMNQLKTLIAQGKLKQALDLLPDTNEFILLKARFSKLKREEQMGVITTENANLESNRITHALLQMLGDDVSTAPPKSEMANKSTTDFAAIIKALNSANWADVIDLLDEHFGDKPTTQYSTLKQTIEGALTQGQQPNPATQQSLQMLINKLKKQ